MNATRIRQAIAQKLDLVNHLARCNANGRSEDAFERGIQAGQNIALGIAQRYLADLMELVERHEPRTLATDSVAFAELFKASMGPAKGESVAESDDDGFVDVDELFAA